LPERKGGFVMALMKVNPSFNIYATGINATGLRNFIATSVAENRSKNKPADALRNTQSQNSDQSNNPVVPAKDTVTLSSQQNLNQTPKS